MFCDFYSRYCLFSGDTLYFKFTSDSSNNEWGYKFTVSGGRQGRFDTGYTILNTVLSGTQGVRYGKDTSIWNLFSHYEYISNIIYIFAGEKMIRT